MDYTKENGILKIDSPDVRGYSWKLIRIAGYGTYASIAGAADDEEIVIEEYDSPEYRKIWDSASDEDVILWAYTDIQEEIKNGRENGF